MIKFFFYLFLKENIFSTSFIIHLLKIIINKKKKGNVEYFFLSFQKENIFPLVLLHIY